MNACTVQCKYHDRDEYYAPHLHVEGLKHKDVDGFFNYGSFCHEEGGTKFYCKYVKT